MEFKTVYLGMPPAGDTRRQRLAEVAEDYCYRTEVFDRSVCKVFKNGRALPVTPEQMAACNSNARSEFAYAMRLVDELGFTRMEFMEAIRRVHQTRKDHE